MTVMSEGLLLNSKYIKMGREAVHSRNELILLSCLVSTFA